MNRLQHSWVLCLPHVFKGTLCQFEKIAKRGAAVMGRQGRERGVARKHKAPLQEQAGAASWWCKAGNCLGTVQHWVGSALVHPRCAFHLTSQHLFSPPPSPKPPYLIFLLHFPLACSTQGLQLGAFSSLWRVSAEQALMWHPALSEWGNSHCILTAP